MTARFEMVEEVAREIPIVFDEQNIHVVIIKGGLPIFEDFTRR
jgi:hypothetical protein